MQQKNQHNNNQAIISSSSSQSSSPSPEKLPEVLAPPGLAAPTATTNGRFVAAVFATGDLVCLTMEGMRVWAKNLGVPNNSWCLPPGPNGETDYVRVFGCSFGQITNTISSPRVIEFVLKFHF